MTKFNKKELEEMKDYLENLFNYANIPIIIWDPKFNIVRFSNAFMGLTGYTNSEVIGRKLDMLFPKANRKKSLGKIRRASKRECWKSEEISILCKNGDIRIVVWNSANNYAADGRTLTGTIAQGIDITERKEARKSLKEKQMLLKEIHHRIKNNLQIVSSLLNLQSIYIKDKQSLEIFKASQNRIRLMALVHEKLYQSKELARISFAEYTQSLISYLFRSYGVGLNVIPKINIKNVSLDMDTAVSCGLIISELVSNSIKYAFPKGRKGEIQIEIHQDNNNYIILIISDNGIGFPKDLDFRKTKSLGLQLVNTSVKQLGGIINLSREKGTRFEIKFTPPE